MSLNESETIRAAGTTPDVDDASLLLGDAEPIWGRHPGPSCRIQDSATAMDHRGTHASGDEERLDAGRNVRAHCGK